MKQQQYAIEKNINMDYSVEKEILAHLQGIIDNAPEGTVVQCVEKGGHMMMEYDPQNTAALTLPVMEKMK